MSVASRPSVALAAPPLLLQLNGDAVQQMLAILVLLLVVFVGLPLLVGTLAYAVFRRHYPRVPARRTTVLRYAGGAYWLVGLAASTLPIAPRGGHSRSLFLGLGAVVGIGLTLGGAALGYFKKSPAA